MLLGRFLDRIAGFNDRQLTLADLAELCDRKGIELVQMPLRSLHGCALYQDGIPFLYINSRLNASDKVIAGFHEFCHLTDHALEVGVFKSTGNLWNLRKLERQAQTIGVLAWMPEAEAAGLEIDELMARFAVRREVAEFRSSLLA